MFVSFFVVAGNEVNQDVNGLNVWLHRAAMQAGVLTVCDGTGLSNCGNCHNYYN